VRDLRREHIEAWLIELLGRWKPATVNNRYRGLQAFFRWCIDEDIIATSPMAKMKPPKVPEQPVPVLRLDAVAKLIATAERTKTFQDVRDNAILRIFYSTGVRLAELSTLRYLPADPESNDVDLDQQVLRVLGKGGRQRLVNMGVRSTKALDRYLRLRRAHHDAHSPWLWLSRQGRFTENGIGQMVARRGRSIGLKVHPHQLRHSWAHAAQVKGMGTNDLKMTGGWRSNAMVERYASSTRDGTLTGGAEAPRPGDDL
jgi:site-specific recombinase XerD